MKININTFRASKSYPLSIGRQGENLAKTIQFDYSDWREQFGDGLLGGAHLRSGDSVPYPLTLDLDEGIATWTPTSTDTANAGTGKLELSYYVDDVIKKSVVLYTKVEASLEHGQAPEPYDDWLETLEQMTTEVTSARDTAVQSSTEAQASAETARTSAESVLGVLDEVTPLAEQVRSDAASVSADKSVVVEKATQVASDAVSTSRSASAALTSETNAKASEDSAKASADEARWLVEDILTFSGSDGNIVITMKEV